MIYLRSLLPFLILFHFFFASAQEAGSIRGQIVDEAKDGVEYASVVLLRLPDSSMVMDTQSATNGRFRFDDVKPGNYAVRITFIGFMENEVGPISVESGSARNVGIVNLKQDARLLDAVVVERTAPAVQYELDKTVFNITPDVKAMSVNATEILEQIPMVELSEEGSPSVMGQNLTVLIDGRPSRIYGDNIETVLKLIPSGIIEKVEVITSPSARYTTEGGGIVLNIVTRADRLVGINGIASLNVTSNNNYSPSINVNVTRKRIGFNNSLSFDYDKTQSSSEVFRENRLDPVFFTDQQRDGTDKDKDFSYNGNLFYEFGENTTAGLFFGFGRDTEDEVESLLTRTLSANNELTSAYTRYIDAEENSWQYRGGVDFKQTFANEDQVLDFKAYYSTRKDNDLEIFDQESAWEDLDYLQRQVSDSYDEGFTVELDYVHPFGEKSRLETGLRADWETEENNFLPSTFAEQIGGFIVDTSLVNDFLGKDRQFSAYAMYRTSFERLSVQAGARIEQAVLEGEQRLLGQSYDNDFLNLIPTLNLSYRLKNEDNLKFSYSRRANRPRWRQLNPFVDYSNPNNIQSGNPALDPELINSFEFSYGRFINQFNVFGSVFYRNSDNPIQQISTIDDQGISYTTFDNIGKENYYGLETGASADILSNWNVRLNIGVRRNDVLGFERENSATSFTGRFSTFFPLPAGFRGYAFVNYQGPRAIAQGETKGMLISNVGVRKSFMDKKINLSLRLSDVFNNRQYAQTIEQTSFFQTSNYQRQSRFFSLGINFIFGGLKDAESSREEDAAPGNFEDAPDL